MAVEEVRMEQVGDDPRVFVKRDGRFTARSRSLLWELDGAWGEVRCLNSWIECLVVKGGFRRGEGMLGLIWC